MNQYISDVTAVSTKGQVVLPKVIREQLNLSSGSKLMAFTDGKNILLKPITMPQMDEFTSRIFDDTCVFMPIPNSRRSTFFAGIARTFTAIIAAKDASAAKTALREKSRI